MNKEFNPLLKLNLQHFAESQQTVAGVTEPIPQQGAVQDPASAPTQTAAQPQAAPAQVSQPSFDLNEIVSNISSKLDESLNNRLAPIEQRLNQPTAEQIQAQNEKIKQEFDSDPVSFIRRIQEEAKTQALNEIKSQYDPLIQKTEQLNNRLSWQDNVRTFLASNPQAQQYMPQISQVIQENPGLLGTSNPLEIAYKTVVSNSLLGNNGNVIDGILGNEELKSQLLQNPQLKEAIIQEYQAGLNNGSQQGLPPLMGNNQTGTQIPASGGELPRNIKDAKQSALRRLQTYSNMNMQ